jgi:hypothetical protein
LSWNSSQVSWDEVALDAGGLLGDIIPILQPPATVAEGVKVYNHGLNVAEVYLDAADIVTADTTSDVDWFNVLLDGASFVPEFGAIPSAVGLVYNLQKGIVINSYPLR